MNTIRATLTNAEPTLSPNGEPMVSGILVQDSENILADNQPLAIGPILDIEDTSVFVTRRARYRVEWSRDWEWLGQP